MGNSWVKGLVKCFLVLEQMRNALILSKQHVKCAWHYGNWRIWLGKIKEAGLEYHLAGCYLSVSCYHTNSWQGINLSELQLGYFRRCFQSTLWI